MNTWRHVIDRGVRTSFILVALRKWCPQLQRRSGRAFCSVASDVSTTTRKHLRQPQANTKVGCHGKQMVRHQKSTRWQPF